MLCGNVSISSNGVDFMAASQKQQVLFLSPGNEVRSILAEYFLNSKRIGLGRFKAFSAGSRPTGIVHPYVIRVLEDYYKIDAREARSKSWDEFRNMHFDMIITLFDRGKESCPFFPGQPNIATWNIPNPGLDIRSNVDMLIKIKDVAQQIQTRIQLLGSFPLEKLGHLRRSTQFSGREHYWLSNP
jgi:arsenate reductase